MKVIAELEAGDPRQVGRYRIVARLGAGGMGRVFLARTPGGRSLAVKVVRAELAEDTGFRQRFAREVATARRVTGVFTASVVDADPEGTPAWLATEYVPGMSLGEAIAEHGAWPGPAVLALGAGLAEAMEAIHDAGVVHRDLKPSNVLLASDGPRVIDFGISLTDGTSVLTQTGTVVGTPGFMSPEQLVSGGQVGPASDVFSLGAVLTYAATGSGPFGAGAPHALHYRIVHERPDLSALPPVLGAVVARCLAKDPEERPAVADLLAELARALRDEGQEAPQPHSEHGWLPLPVARALQEHVRGGIAPPPPQPGEAGAEAGQAAHHAPTRTGRAPRPAPAHPPTALAAPAPAPEAVPAPVPAAPPPAAPSSPGAPLTDGAPGRTRRQLLIAAAALGTAGIGFAGWQLAGDSGGGTGEESSGDSSPKGSGGNRSSGGSSGGKVASGTLRWSVPEFNAPSPASVADGTVYMGHWGGSSSEEASLRALDASNGRQRWRVTMPDQASGASPVFAGGTVFMAGDGGLQALDAADGSRRWSFPLPDEPLATSPVFADGTVCVGGSRGTLYAVDAGTGRRRWRYRYPGNGHNSGPAPVIADGIVYIGDGQGELHAVDAATGRRRWTSPTKPDRAVLHPAAVTDGTVCLSNDDMLYGFDAAGGKRLWDFPTMREYSTPVAADGVVYVHESDGYLYAVDGANGKQPWRFPLNGRVEGAPSVGEGTVCFGGKDGTVYAVDTATGRERWVFDTRGEARDDSVVLQVPPVIADGTVYFTAGDDLMLELPALYAVAL
ncbi:PQQ-binding-like beta-propeller repeat protein [Streptomyces sp. NPDC091649]|uniref:outer membrane protein assembly factor BamB family protein n=1 Tax=Streptomyces sp. NPDC091649 TaxID=3366004 RepID=UPI0037F64776